MSTHRPGAWPVTEPVDLDVLDDQGEQRAALNKIRARFHVTLGAIRADLEEQPSPMCVRSAARRWTEAITAMAEDVAAAQKRDAA